MLVGKKNRELWNEKQDVEKLIYCLKKKRNSKNYRGQRGKQKIPPSGHLAPTIQMKKGRFYPRLNSVTEEERRAKLYNHPEDKAEWFVWIYQWKEKDRDDFWKTRSKSVPTCLIHSIKYMIGAEKSVGEILNFIVQHS
jgi:hypothetical protein